MSLPVALIDWDGTLRAGFTIVSWVRYLVERGLIAKIAVNELQVAFDLYRCHKISHDNLAFRSANIYAKHMNGKEIKEIESLATEFVSSDRENLMEFTLDLLCEFNKRDFEIVVVSGAPCEILSEYSDFLKFSKLHCLELKVENKRFNGLVCKNYGLSSLKKEAVESVIKSGSTNIIVGIGNSESDLPLLSPAKTKVIVGNFIIGFADSYLSLNKKSDLQIILKSLS
jgi:phosphoserine phosphatase